MIGLGKMDPQEEQQTAPEIMDKPLSTAHINASINSTNDKRAGVDMPAVPLYPQGEFIINRTRVIFARSGTSMLAIADQYHLSLGRLLEFNDLQQEEVLVTDQLLYLQRKRKVGENEFHIVKPGESLYAICQSEGIRFECLLQLNQLSNNMQPATGEKLYLQNPAPLRPLLAKENNKKTFEQNIAVENGHRSFTQNRLGEQLWYPRSGKSQTD